MERLALARIREYVGIPHVVVITGLRRSGKSTLMRQIIKAYYHDSEFYYVSFEDERLLGFQAGDFNMIYEALLELYGKQGTFFIDEIQAVPEFDRFIRRFYDSGFKFFISGSNASLLRLDISTRLTGRHVDVTLKPFSFPEFLRLRDVDVPDPARIGTEARVKMRILFEEYLVTGGMPERLIFKREEIIDHIYEDIVIKDVAVRHGITDVRSLRELYQYLVANFCRKFSFNALQKATSIKSANTVKAYVGHLEDTYLAVVVPRFEHSVKKWIAAAKKFYVLDNGFVKRVSPTVTVDKGWLLENMVVATLHDGGNVFYHGNDKECDVVLMEHNVIGSAIQVTRELTPDNKGREVGGLVEAMADLHLGDGLVVTEDQEDEIVAGGKRVAVVPAWQWALDPTRTKA